jgi:arsenate reductase
MYGIRNCDTVKKARAWLEKHGVRYDFHWCSELGWEALLNRAGTTFRKLNNPEKENLKLGERLVVGFKPELYKTIKWR